MACQVMQQAVACQVAAMINPAMLRQNNYQSGTTGVETSVSVNNWN